MGPYGPKGNQGQLVSEVLRIATSIKSYHAILFLSLLCTFLQGPKGTPGRDGRPGFQGPKVRKEFSVQ